MPKIIVNVVEWSEEGDRPKFRHTGETFEISRSELGLDRERSEEIAIDSDFPLVVRYKKWITADGKEILNISMSHKLIGLISDYYLYNSSGALRKK
jgi:hypothetical protein